MQLKIVKLQLVKKLTEHQNMTENQAVDEDNVYSM